MSDNQHIVFWTGGKINTETSETGIIPFEVEAIHKIAEAAGFKHNPAPETFTVKAIRHAKTSPDGHYALFNAAGKGNR